MNKQDANNQSIIIEDLTAANTDEIKGGPKKIFIGGLSVEETAPTLPTSNHNETVSEDNDLQEATTEPLADLNVDQDTEAEIKGGMQYRAKRAELPSN
jgi:hypothetical protein